MEKYSKTLIGAGILAVIVAAGILAGWLGSRVPPGRVQGRSQGDSSANTNARSGTASSRNPVEPAASTPLIQTLPQPAAPAPATTNLAANWEDLVDQILGSDDDDTNKVKEFFAILPTLPEDGQEEVAQHLSNLVEDENYAPLGDLLKNAKLPEPVLETLMADLLNRPNSLKLPMFLELARNPEHPKAEESMDYLELFLDEEYGTDWAKWQQKMEEWLKENPD
jgi:hypothetical protein